MRRTISIWSVVAVFACVLTAFVICGGNLQKSVDELDAIYAQNTRRLTELKNEKAELENTLAQAGTDTFVENQARSLYGYMMPDEIRFVITNPEALYGDEEVPSR